MVREAPEGGGERRAAVSLTAGWSSAKAIATPAQRETVRRSKGALALSTFHNSKGGMLMLSLRPALRFVVLATVTLVLIANLVIAEIFPIRQDLAEVPLDPRVQEFVRWWLRIGLALGVLLPLVVFLVKIRLAAIRQILGPYLFVLISQIATEATMRRCFFTSMLVIIGTIYTAYRLFQLRQASIIFRESKQLPSRTRSFVKILLWSLVIFWGINFSVLLIGIEWPRLFGDPGTS